VVRERGEGRGRVRGGEGEEAYVMCHVTRMLAHERGRHLRTNAIGTNLNR